MAHSNLKVLREAAGLSQRELARQLDQDQSNIRYWETTGKTPRSDVLVPMAAALGVSVEQLLGADRSSRTPAGKLGQVFRSVTKLPRSQQKKVIEFVEAFVNQQSRAA